MLGFEVGYEDDVKCFGSVGPHDELLGDVCGARGPGHQRKCARLGSVCDDGGFFEGEMEGGSIEDDDTFFWYEVECYGHGWRGSDEECSGFCSGGKGTRESPNGIDVRFF